MTSAPTLKSAAASEEAAGSPEVPLAAPIRLAGSRGRPTVGLRLAALLAALAGHSAALYWAARKPPDPLAGAHGQLLAAVNVTVVSPGVLESREVRPAPPTSAMVKTVEAEDGALQSTPRPSSAEQKEERAEAKQPPNELIPDDAVAKMPPPKAEEQEKERREASPAVQPVGGASARGESPTTTKQSAPAAARAGVVRAYANAVAEALSRRKLKPAPAYGKVQVKLVIAADGGVASIEVLKSSGNRRLDDAVLKELRRAKVPAPPPGLDTEERWFEFTYRVGR